jgi:hypothetical protein
MELRTTAIRDKPTASSILSTTISNSPQQVYDLFFPIDFRFLCNHQRPAICSRFGLPEDYLWRFEFLVSPEEDGEVLAGPEKMRDIVFPYITHKGSDYGLSDVDSIQFPKTA